jgi:pyridoxamine 5'-phosphate oxidase
VARDLGESSPERPEHWGGYLLRPEVIEFWQGRDSRMHDRFRYTRRDGPWRIERLAP